TRTSSRTFVWTLCAIFLLTAAKGQPDLQQQLANRYGNRILTLRHSFTSSSQRYDFDGAPLISAASGPWTVYGRIAVDKIKIKPDELRIEGRRVIFKLDEKTNVLVPFTDRDRVNVSIRLQKPLTSETEANAILGHVFAVTRQDSLDSVPVFW